VLRGSIKKFPDWVDKEIYAPLWYYSLRSNTKGYGGKTQTDSQNSDTTAPSGRELYHFQFSPQEASPETFGCTLVVSPRQCGDTAFWKQTTAVSFHILPRAPVIVAMTFFIPRYITYAVGILYLNEPADKLHHVQWAQRNGVKNVSWEFIEIVNIQAKIRVFRLVAMFYFPFVIRY